MTIKISIIIGLLLLVLCGSVLLTPGIYAQQSSSMHPAIALPEDYRFAAVTRSSPTYGQHQSVTGVHYGPLVAFSDSGSAVFLGDFFDPHTGPVRGLFMSNGRVIAEDGQRIGDITILQIRATEPYDLQINRGNDVGWIAQIQARACGQASSCLALFVNERLVAVTGLPTPNAYALGDNGKITAPAGHSWITPAAGTAAAFGGAGRAGSTAGAVAVEVARHLPWVRLPGITIPTGPRSTPVAIDPDVLRPDQIATEIAQGIPTVPGQPGAVQQKAPFEPMAQLPYCAPPAGGGWPDDWSRNANAAGPIASERQEFVRGGFISLFHPQVRAWIKKTFYSGDCRPILVSAGEYPGVTQEGWTPSGMVFSYDAGDAVYRFNGVPPVALPAADFPIETGIRVNRRCAVLAVVAFKRAVEDESAVIVGTPTKAGHCPLQ